MADSDLTVVPELGQGMSTVFVWVPESSRRCYLSVFVPEVFHVRVPEAMRGVYVTSAVHEARQPQKRRFP